MKKFFKEFKEFISKGNVMDMAVGIIIGSAFTGIVNSFVSDIISPFLGLFGGVNFDSMQLQLIGDVTLNYGSFITNVINFIIIALVIFCMVKLMNKLTSVVKHPEEKKPTTKKCPFCQSDIAIAATRCPHCTSMLEVSDMTLTD